jgi:DNA polymerase-1
LEETARVVKETMTNAYKLDIPLSTDARYGTNWGEMQPI